MLFKFRLKHGYVYRWTMHRSHGYRFNHRVVLHFDCLAILDIFHRIWLHRDKELIQFQFQSFTMRTYERCQLKWKVEIFMKNVAANIIHIFSSKYKINWKRANLCENWRFLDKPLLYELVWIYFNNKQKKQSERKKWGNKISIWSILYV